MTDTKYIIICLAREFDVASCHCQYRSRNHSNMAAHTGSTYISGTTIDSVEIPTTNLRFSIVASSKEVPPDDSNNDQQPEVAT